MIGFTAAPAPSADVIAIQFVPLANLYLRVKSVQKLRLVCRGEKGVVLIIAHMLIHSPAVLGRPGCDAKAKSRRHRRKAFKRDHLRHKDEMSLDQVTMADIKGTGRLGAFRYGIVQSSIEHNLWSFEPLESQESKDIG